MFGDDRKQRPAAKEILFPRDKNCPPRLLQKMTVAGHAESQSQHVVIVEPFRHTHLLPEFVVRSGSMTCHLFEPAELHILALTILLFWETRFTKLQTWFALCRYKHSTALRERRLSRFAQSFQWIQCAQECRSCGCASQIVVGTLAPRIVGDCLWWHMQNLSVNLVGEGIDLLITKFCRKDCQWLRIKNNLPYSEHVVGHAHKHTHRDGYYVYVYIYTHHIYIYTMYIYIYTVYIYINMYIYI
jgi:hypothetical protein